MDDNIKTRNGLITLTEAAGILGYKNFRSVNKLIKKGELKAYKIPLHEHKKMVMKSEVESLLEPILIKLQKAEAKYGA